MNSKAIGIIFFVIIIIISIAVISQPKQSNTKNTTSSNQTVLGVIRKTITIKSTFNLSDYLNKSLISNYSNSNIENLIGNVTYGDALSKAYASNHSQNAFYYFLQTLPTITVSQTGIVPVNISENAKITIKTSGSRIVINLNNHYAFITVVGSYDNITVENGLYNTYVETTNGAKGDVITFVDAYQVVPW